MNTQYNMFVDLDIIENILSQSTIEDAERLCISNKNIRTLCQDKKIWKMLIDRNNVRLFRNIDEIDNFSQFMEEYKIYKSYEKQADEIIRYAMTYNVYLFLDLNITLQEKENLLNFIDNFYDNYYANQYGNLPVPNRYERQKDQTADKLLEINFDFTNRIIAFLYELDVLDITPIRAKFLWTMKNLLIDLLFYFPNIDIKRGNYFGVNQILPDTNIRFLNKDGSEPSVIYNNNL